VVHKYLGYHGFVIRFIIYRGPKSFDFVFKYEPMAELRDLINLYAITGYYGY